MVARSEDGKIIASWQFSQAVQGNEVTMRLTYKFVDGSIDDETTTYGQQGTFRLVRDHQIQKGSSFVKPVDFTVEIVTGIATSRTADKNGNIHVENHHIDVPDDLANGFVGILLLNAPQNTTPFWGGDAGASQQRTIDSNPDLSGGRAAVSHNRTDAEGDGVSHPSGVRRHHGRDCVADQPSAERCDGVGT